MTAPTITWEVSIGTILQAVLIAAGLLIGYGTFSARFTELGTTVESTRRQTTRMERYLSSHDPDYWHKVHQIGDAN